MSAQVTLRPSGHQFAVEGHDTLLQAGLRAGLKLNYGCGNGTCGMCKVRVIGRPGRAHDAQRLPDVRGRAPAGLCTDVRAHRRQCRADAGDAGGRRPGGHPAAGARGHGARAQAARRAHAGAAPADAAHAPAALPGRAARHAGPGRRRRRRPPSDPAGGQLPLRRPQPALLRRARRTRPVRRPGCSTARSRPAPRSACAARSATSCSPTARGRWSSPPATPASRRSRA